MLGDPSLGLRVNDNGTFNNGDGVNAAYLRLQVTGVAVDKLGTGLGVINFANPNNTVEYNFAGNQTVYATTYDRLICASGGTKTQGAGTVTVNTDLTISGSSVYVAGTNTLDGAGNLTMTGTSELQLASTGVNLPGLTGVANSLASSTTITLNGAGAQTLKSDTQFPYQNIRIINSSAANLNNVTTIAGNVTLASSGAITSISNGGLNVNGTYSTTSNGATDISGGTGNLTVGNMVVAGGGTLNYSGKTIAVVGNNGTWTNNGGITLVSNGTSNVVFSTGTNQQITGTTATVFPNLTINNLNDVTLSGVNTTASSTLTLTAGRLITGSQKVIATAVTRTSGFVEGTLQKPIAVGTNVSQTFEVGTASSYTPVTLLFATVSGAGTGFSVRSLAGDHPDILSSNIEPGRSVNRYYTITNVGSVTFTTVSANFTFVPGDVDAGFDPTVDAIIRGYNSINWFNTTTGVRTATSTEFVNLAASSLPNNSPRDFQIGKRIITTGYFNRLTGTRNWHDITTWINNRQGTISLTNGSNAVAGTNTLFTTQLLVGDQIVLQSTPSATPLVVQAIIDDENLLLSAPYTGADVSGGFGRLRIPNNPADSVTIGNPAFTGGSDLATTIQLDANATVNTLNINSAPTSGRVTEQVLTHLSTNTLTVGANVVVNQPSNSSGTVTDAWNINAGSAVLGGNLTIASANNSATRLAQVTVTSGTLTLGGNLIFNTSGNAGRETSSVLSVTSGRVNLGGAIVYNANRGTLTMGPSAVFNFNRTAGSQDIQFPSQSTAAFVFSNIEGNNTSVNGLRVVQDITGSNVTGNIRVLTGTLQMVASGNPNITGTGSNTFEVANGATLEMLGNGSQLFPSGFLTYVLGNSSNVYYSQTGNLTLPLTPTSYGNIFFTGSPEYSITNPTFTINGNMTVGNGTATTSVVGSGTTTLILKRNFILNANAAFNATNIPSIFIDGDWTCNGTFTSGGGANFVEFTGNGILQPQVIGGTTPETFNRLNINTNDASDRVRLSKNTNVSNVLTLVQGGLEINGNRIAITNPSPSALVRSFPGFIQSETTTSPYSRIRWTINNSTGTFVFPFGKSETLADYIPFTLQITGAGGPTGTFEVSTYPTAANNTPYPSGVTNMNGGGDDMGGQVVDRFWILTPNGFATTSPTSTLTFTCTAGEASGIAGNLGAQRWNPANYWDGALVGQTNPTATSVTVPNVSSYSPWTLASVLAPLPIQLLSFSGKTVGEVVEISWATASEINNHYFTVEHAVDGIVFSPLFDVPGAGTSHQVRSYYAIDETPVRGRNYYRLKQTDYDGKYEYSKVITVEVEHAPGVSVFPNPSRGQDVFVRWPHRARSIDVKVSRVSGMEIFSRQIEIDENGRGNISFAGELMRGLYVVELTDGVHVAQLKLVVD